MGLVYESISDETRAFMLQEFNSDIMNDTVYLRKRFNANGTRLYANFMIKHIKDGHDDGLSEDLNSNDFFTTHEERKTKTGTIMARVPDPASQTFAEGEFNRYYLRGLCLRSIKEKRQLQVYRGRISENPRPNSEASIGSFIDPVQLLSDLRENKGVDTALGLPNGPNSGLTLRLV